MLDVKPKALSGGYNMGTEIEGDYESCFLSENLSDRRLKWPDYNIRPKFLASMYSRDNSPVQKRTMSPTMLRVKPEFAYPQRKILEREFPVVNIEAECRTTYTNHDSKQAADRNISTKKNTATDDPTTASPSKSPERGIKDKQLPKGKKPISKNPFHKDKDKEKLKQVQSTTNVSTSRSRKRNPLEGWETPAEEYKFPPSKPKLSTVGEMSQMEGGHNSILMGQVKKGQEKTSLHQIDFEPDKMINTKH